MKDNYNISDNRLISRYMPADYCDSVTKRTKAGETVPVDTLFCLMFEDFPWPVRFLLRLRDALVKPFGLKGGVSFDEHIIARNDNEIVLGMDDKHLEYAVSLYAERGNIEVFTIVKFHNLMGRFYFAAIWLFHTILVSGQFRRAIKKIGSAEV